MGEYYLKNKRYSQARYVFSRYLTYYPSGKKAFMAAKNLEIAENALVQFGDGKGTVVPASADPNGASSTPPPDKSKAAKAYYDAVSLISQKKYQPAFGEFKKIVDANGDMEWTARSLYEMGRCLFFVGRFEDCIKHYTMMITKNPRHPDLRNAIFYIGQCHEKAGRTEQAAAF